MAEEVRQYPPSGRAWTEDRFLFVRCSLAVLRRRRFAELAEDVRAANLDYARELLLRRLPLEPEADPETMPRELSRAARELGLNVLPASPSSAGPVH